MGGRSKTLARDVLVKSCRTQGGLAYGKSCTFGLRIGREMGVILKRPSGDKLDRREERPHRYPFSESLGKPAVIREEESRAHLCLVMG